MRFQFTSRLNAACSHATVALDASPRPCYRDVGVLTPRFEAYWSKGVRGTPTHANGLTAIAWYVRAADGIYHQHSLEVVRFDGEEVAESTHFVGSHYLTGFDLLAERHG